MADGLARSGWDKDLAFGESRETAFVQALRDAHVECKSDQKARSTGNVAIEIRQGSTERSNGKLSGLSVSTARWWCIEYMDDCWLVVRTSLLKLATRLVYDEAGSVMGGDGNRFELVLVPIEILVRPVRLERAG